MFPPHLQGSYFTAIKSIAGSPNVNLVLIFLSSSPLIPNPPVNLAFNHPKTLPLISIFSLSTLTTPTFFMPFHIFLITISFSIFSHTLNCQMLTALFTWNFVLTSLKCSFQFFRFQFNIISVQMFLPLTVKSQMLVAVTCV